MAESCLAALALAGLGLFLRARTRARDIRRRRELAVDCLTTLVLIGRES